MRPGLRSRSLPTGIRRCSPPLPRLGRSLAAAGAYVLLRWPWVLPFATLACVPVRIPVDVGDEKANLLLPLYLVVAAFALALGWRLLRGDERSRELGPAALPLAAFVAWTGVTLAWSEDVREGSIFLLAFVLPFGLLAVGFARLPWSRRALLGLYGALAATALAYASVGVFQWATRDVFWNPRVIVGNAYAPFYRVNSVFWDPSIYGRYLVVAILATLALVLLGVRTALARGRNRADRRDLGGPALLLLAVELRGARGRDVSPRRRSSGAGAPALALGLVAVVLISVGFATPQVRTKLLRESRAGLNSATSGRAGLVSNGLRIAADHPVAGVGVGGFKRAYADRTGLRGKEPKKAASHSTPVTVAAEAGVPGVALLAWLAVAALGWAYRSRGRTDAGRLALVAGLTLGAIAVHSLFYNALFEDPTTWALLGLVALAGVRRVGGARMIECLEAGPRARAAHRRRRARLRRHDGAARRGRDRGPLPRLLDRDALAAGRVRPDTLAREVREATAELGIPEAQLTVHDFDVRTFPERRQDILELLVATWEELRPDAVFQPSHHDVHQDHQTIAQEGLRAFKRTTVLGYEIPWNNFDFSYGAYVALEKHHVERKVAALERVRLPAAPPLRESRVRLEPRPRARDQREPRLRGVLPGLPHRHVAARRARRARWSSTPSPLTESLIRVLSPGGRA